MLVVQRLTRIFSCGGDEPERMDPNVGKSLPPSPVTGGDARHSRRPEIEAPSPSPMDLYLPRPKIFIFHDQTVAEHGHNSFDPIARFSF